jgi:hypothetical protein
VSTRARLTEPDVEVLRYAAEHRFILAVHAASLLGVTPAAASRRLQRRVAAGHLRWERKLAGPGAYQVTRPGLAAIGSRLRPPREIDLGLYDHDLGLAWVWLAARRGRFGALADLTSERAMRSHDARAEPGQEPLGVRLAGVGPHGGARRHYPDLLLHTASGRRMAVELELTSKSARRRRNIMAGYGIDARIDAVLYLVETEAMRRSLQASAAAAGVSALVHVLTVRFLPGSGATGRGRARSYSVEASASMRKPAAMAGVSR